MGPDGDLSINDFIVASMNQYRNLSDAVIKTMFRALDKDDDGWITAEDAFEALQPTGVHISVRELTKLFDKYGVKRRLGDAHAQTGARPHLRVLCRAQSVPARRASGQSEWACRADDVPRVP